MREILPTLFNLLLSHLASNSYDKRQVAARTLGDLVKKLGERVLPEIIPILEKGLESEHSEKRQGGDLIALTSFGRFLRQILGDFCPIFNAGCIALESVYTGVFFNLTLPAIFWANFWAIC